jgi:hypothetical protein
MSNINSNSTEFKPEGYDQSTTQATYMHQNITSYRNFDLLMNVLNLTQYEIYLNIIPIIISVMKLPYKIPLY